MKLKLISCILLVTSALCIIGCSSKKENKNDKGIISNETATSGVSKEGDRDDSEIVYSDKEGAVQRLTEDPNPDAEIVNENTTDKIKEGNKRIGDGNLGFLNVPDNFIEGSVDINFNPSGNLLQGNTYCFKSDDSNYVISVTNYLDEDISNIANDLKANHKILEDNSDIRINSIDGIHFEIELDDNRNADIYLFYNLSKVQAVSVSYPKGLNGSKEFIKKIIDTYYIG